MKKPYLIYFVLTVCCFAFCSEIDNAGEQPLLKSSSSDKDKKKDKDGSTEVTIKQKWDLPEDLKEVSGIAYLTDDRFACVQDEMGTVYIYNSGSGNIEKKIAFAAAGDYEGITVNGNMAYIVRADGRIFEVNMDEGNPTAKEYATHLTMQQNVEGVCYDNKNNRLLLAIKGDEPGNKNYKGIYAFSLASKTLGSQPVYKIDLDNSIFNTTRSKKGKTIMPSEIAVHPVNGDLYITDGPNARLLIMDQAGKMKAWYNLGKKFTQPEGITFSPDGDLFISNEGAKQSGNIIEVTIE